MRRYMGLAEINEVGLFAKVNVVSLASDDLILTESDSGSWIVITDGGHGLKLADATSFSRLGWQFGIANESVDIVTVRDYVGNLLAVVPPSEKVELFLYDNSTSEGKWFVKQENPVGAFLRPKNGGLSGGVSISGTYADMYRVGDAIPLGEDRFFTVTGGSSLYGRVFQVGSDRQTITEIASLQIVDYAVSAYPRVCKLSDSKLFVLFDKDDTANNVYDIYMTVLNWDGSNLTVDVSPTVLRSSQSRNGQARNDCVMISESEIFIFDCWDDGSWHHEGVVVQYDSENRTLSVKTRATANSRYNYINTLVENSNSFWAGQSGGYTIHFTYDGSSITRDGGIGSGGFFNPVLFQSKPLGLYWDSSWDSLDYARFQIYFNVYDSSSLSYETKASYWKLGLRQIFTRNLPNPKMPIFFGYLHENKHPEIIRLTKDYSIQLFRTVNEDSYLGSYFVQLSDKLLVDATQFKVVELTQPLWSK